VTHPISGAFRSEEANIAYCFTLGSWLQHDMLLGIPYYCGSTRPFSFSTVATMRGILRVSTSGTSPVQESIGRVDQLFGSGLGDAGFAMLNQLHDDMFFVAMEVRSEKWSYMLGI
jgi:hypothetical protein